MAVPFDPYGAASALLPNAVASQIPGNVIGANSFTINTSELNFSSQPNLGGMFGYTGTPGMGNLFFALAPVGGTDSYGNTYAGGINVLAGSMGNVSLVGSTMDETSVLNGTSIQGPQILAPTVSGGTAVSLMHTMTGSNGGVLGYTIANATAVTYATSGVYQWTCPTGISDVRVRCWGAGGAGAGGGPSYGGSGGGGGAYSEEPSYAVIPGSVYTIVVGNGGTSTPGEAGGDGTETLFSNVNYTGLSVAAAGGSGGYYLNGSAIGGQGGPAYTSTISYAGGNGANEGGTGGSGGGSSAAPGGEGNPGNIASGSTGGTGGSALPGGGAGGAGGNAGTAGTNATAPGGGGGGAGQSAQVGTSKTYDFTSFYSYGTANDNALRDHNGTCYQGMAGGVAGTQYGYQYSYMVLPYTQIKSDLLGATVTAVAIKLHVVGTSWSSAYANMRYASRQSWGSHGDGGVGHDIQNFSITPGTVITQNVGTAGGIGAALEAGTATSILFGPATYSNIGPWYAAYDNGSNGVKPQLTVYFSTAATVLAGNGADGQCVLSYNSATVPTFQLAVSSVSSIDPYGNSYNAGFTGPGLALTNLAAAPATAATTSNLGSNTSGNLVGTNSQGFSGNLPLVQTDVSGFNVTSSGGFFQVSNAYTVPANDANAGTAYRLRVYGNGFQGATVYQFRLAVNALGATQKAEAEALPSVMAASSYFGWNAEVILFVTATGSSGTGQFFLAGAYGAAVTDSNGALSGQNENVTINTVSAGTIELTAAWTGTATGTAINSVGSTLERLGPLYPVWYGIYGIFAGFFLNVLGVFG